MTMISKTLFLSKMTNVTFSRSRQQIPGVPCWTLPNLPAISFPDRKAKRGTVYLGMFKAKILVLGPCEVTCFVCNAI